MAHLAVVPPGAADEAHTLMYELRTRLGAGVESDFMSDEHVVESVAVKKDPASSRQKAAASQQGGRFVATPAAFDPSSIAAAAAKRAARVEKG
jgi:hypothetical protein